MGTRDQGVSCYSIIGSRPCKLPLDEEHVHAWWFKTASNGRPGDRPGMTYEVVHYMDWTTVGFAGTQPNHQTETDVGHEPHFSSNKCLAFSSNKGNAALLLNQKAYMRCSPHCGPPLPPMAPVTCSSSSPSADGGPVEQRTDHN